MLVSAFDTFVRGSDQSVGKPEETRRDIATYGLAGEIGSVISAIKKRLLAEGGAEQWNVANDEIIEELGDVVWYCFSLADISNPGKPVNIFAHDIANLRQEIGAGDHRADRIRPSSLIPISEQSSSWRRTTFRSEQKQWNSKTIKG